MCGGDILQSIRVRCNTAAIQNRKSELANSGSIGGVRQYYAPRKGFHAEVFLVLRIDRIHLVLIEQGQLKLWHITAGAQQDRE